MKYFREHLLKYNTEKTNSNYPHNLLLNNDNYTDFNTNSKALHIYKKGRWIDALKEFEI